MLAYLFDDAFYYLIPAHSFANGQGWSFDGITRTSGFQVLYGYVAAAVARLTGLTSALPAAMAGLSALALLAAMWVLTTRLGRVYGAKTAGLAALLLVASPFVFQQLTGGLEWTWLVLATALFTSTLLEDNARAPVAALAAFVAVMVRVDLAIFIAIFTLALCRGNVRVVASAAAGASAAVLLTGLNSQLITGRWVPNAVATKQFWASTSDFLPAVAWPRLMRVTGPGLVLTELRTLLGLRSVFVMAAFAGAAVALCAAERYKGTQRFGLAIASTVAIVAYTAAYARGVNIMGDHYSGAIALPMFVLTCALLSACGRFQPAGAGAIGAAALALCINMSWSRPGHLGIAQNAATVFAAAPLDARVAAWNAGLAGWETGKRVTNLDGLANAEVVDAMQAGTLACYLADRRVTHIMDYGFMFAGQIDTEFSGNEEARRRMLKLRNGYDPAKLYRCATLIRSAPDPEIAAQYRLFALNAGCLATLCGAP
jgi:hypothetical protein